MSYSDFTWHHNYKYGNCWTFNFGHTFAESPNKDSSNIWQIKAGPQTSDLAKNVKFSEKIGDTQGLMLLLHTDLARYSSTTEATGWRIVGKCYENY